MALHLPHQQQGRPRKGNFEIKFLEVSHYFFNSLPRYAAPQAGSTRGMYGLQVFYKKLYQHVHVRACAYLGLIMCRSRNTTPSRIHRAPTVMYATPRNGFRPPIIEMVDITIDFVPPKLITSKAVTRFNVGERVSERESERASE